MANLSIDCDGVLVDYTEGYRRLWERNFGETLYVVNPTSYRVSERYGIRELTGSELEHFQNQFDEEFWATLPMIPGAVQACEMLQRNGYTLYCNTAINDRFKEARVYNLNSLGFNFADVLTLGDYKDGYDPHISISPKLENIKRINALVHVDDFIPYLRGTPSNCMNVLISEHQSLSEVQISEPHIHSVECSLLSFAKKFLN